MVYPQQPPFLASVPAPPGFWLPGSKTSLAPPPLTSSFLGTSLLPLPPRPVPTML